MTGSSSIAADAITNILDRTGIILPLSVFTLLALAIVYHDRVLFTKANRSNLYSPPGTWPLIGHTVTAIKMANNRELDTALEHTRKAHNAGWQMTILTQGTLLFLSRPEYIEAVQKTYFDNFVKGDFFRDRFGELLGHNGIFVADGQVWRHARKTASHIFSAGQFRNWVQVVVHEELDKVISVLDAVSAASAAGRKSGNKTAGIITLPELFFRYTLNSFSRMAFSADIGCLTTDPKCLSTPVDFATAFDYVQVVINLRTLMPAFKTLERLTGTAKKVDEAIQTIRHFSAGIIDERLRTVRARKAQEAVDPVQPTHEGGSIAKLAKKDGKDLLDLFLETTQDRDELLTIVLNFLIAGRDTTAQLLSWFFYEMIAHPEHVDEIRKEVSEVLGDCPAEGYRLPYDQMRDLPYTFACITEALRLHPSVPKNAKRCIKDTLLVPSGPNPTNLPPVQVYKGELVGWFDWVMARLPEVWGPDCEEYNPRRFLEEEVDSATGVKRRTVRQYSQWQQHMFNGGPRLCLGMNLANYEALSLVAAVVPLFDFHWATAEQGQTVSWPPTYVSSVTHPMESYMVEFRR
ncbi:hypothetical protein OC842_002823, partial [Tilletia horrida]